MKREDSIGLFWADLPTVKVGKPAPPKRNPPYPVWEEPGFVPVRNPLAFFPPLMTEQELAAAQQAGERLVFDTEVYPNYFLAAFMSIESGKCVYFEMTPDQPFNIARFRWVLENFIIIGFNNGNFDNSISSLVLAGKSLEEINLAVIKLIAEQIQPWLVLRSFKLRSFRFNWIDLISVAPLQASLKIYGGRLHVPRLQDLPFKFGTVLTPAQIAVVRDYCIGSDLVSTAFLYTELHEHIELRENMTIQFGTDLRSKSDAQVAEAVVRHELKRINFSDPQVPKIEIGTRYSYRVPAFMNFRTPILQEVLSIIAKADFIVGESGAIEMPPEVGCLNINIADNFYQMGIGGLHSQETTIGHEAGEDMLLVDRDVASYYPNIILTLGIYPQHLGPNFLIVYKGLVDQRLEAKKKAGDKSLSEAERKSWKIIADALKIAVNGIFGKTGNKHSVLYSPDLTTQITVTGQLCLLMLIERAELAGLKVCSANTDGVLFKCPKARKAELDALIAQWEQDTGFQTEETLYRAVYSRDVNNYIAVKTDGKCKVKGTYSERGSALNSVLSKNPEGLICSDAVQKFLADGTSIEKTITECRDIRRFVTVRTVKGGAVKDGVYLGKAVRWYYAQGETGEMVYALSGNKVPRSDGAKPLLDLPEEFPTDVNFAWYISEAQAILKEIGYMNP